MLALPTWETGSGCARPDVRLHRSISIKNSTFTCMHHIRYQNYRSSVLPKADKNETTLLLVDFRKGQKEERSSNGLTSSNV